MDDPFVIAVDEWIAKVRDRADRITRAIAEDCLARVKDLTPVKTGYLRANWAIVEGNAGAALAGAREGDSLAVILSLKSGVTWTLYNPVVYAARIENGFVGEDSLGRHYDQKGAHMLQQTITEFPSIAAAATARVLAEERR